MDDSRLRRWNRWILQGDRGPAHGSKVGLFVTCLADLIRPRTAFAALTLLRRASCAVEAPASQTCCGQPAFNAGDRGDARNIAQNVIAAFEKFDYVVAPSGSCMGMIRHYPELFADDPGWRARAGSRAAKGHELTSFLVDVLGFRPQGVALEARATYHDSCSGLRESNVMRQPRALLGAVEGSSLRRCPTRSPAAASAARSASNIRRSPTPSSRKRRRGSRERRPICCSAATSAAS